MAEWSPQLRFIYLPDTENGIGTVISGLGPQRQHKGWEKSPQTKNIKWGFLSTVSYVNNTTKCYYKFV